MSDLEGVRGALSETGARHVGRAYSVEPIRVLEGIFHPKLAVLQGDAATHLIVGSGNLTFGGWGHNLELFEHLEPRSNPVVFRDAANFLTNLATSARLTLTNSEALERSITGLEQAASGASEGPVRLVHNLDASIAGQILGFAQTLGGAERLTVASPYFGGVGAVEDLAQLLNLDSYDVHVGQLLAVGGHHFRFSEAPAARPIVLEEFEQEHANPRPLHAKFIEIECANGRILFSGSVNASRAALTEPRNVELGVLRISKERAAARRRPFSGPLPPLTAKVEADGSAGGPVVHATYAGGKLQGQIVGRFSAPGGWKVYLDAEGGRRELGTANVTPEGQFTLSAEYPDRIVYGKHRATLTLLREGRRIQGFVSFVDILGATRRLGSIASPLLRLAGGSDEDDDWATILEWFARNPQETAVAWRKSAPKPPTRDAADPVVALSGLVPQPDPTSPVPTPLTGVGDAGTLERLLRRLRVVIGPSSAGSGRPELTTEPDEGEAPVENKSRQRQRERLTQAFDALVVVLGSRVPVEPELELTRLAELGLFVLLRHSDEPERIADFLQTWIGLAWAHLPQPPGEPELRALGAGIVMLSCVFSGNPRRARRQLIDLLGSDNLPEHLDLDADRLRGLQRLVDVVTTRESWTDLEAEVLTCRIALDEVRSMLLALDQAAPLPEVTVLASSEAFRQLQGLLARGRQSHIQRVSRSEITCPRCRWNMPLSQREEFKSTGLVRLACCNGVLLRSDV
jgi:hypothetical protein